MSVEETSAVTIVPVPKSARVRHYWGIALGVLFFSLLGIYLRPLGDLSVLWPTNAMLLGLFMRLPHLATPHGWVFAAIGYVTADLLTGSNLLISLSLSSVNLLSVGTALAVHRRSGLDAEQLWKEPHGLTTLFLAIVAASVVAGISGGALIWLLLDKPLSINSANWIVAELLCYIIFLPCILSASKPHSWRRRDRRATQRKIIPLVLVVASLLTSVLIGGPGALAFPVIALLACALSYGIFLTSLLTMALSIWTLIGTASGSILGIANASEIDNLLSIRLGVASVALAPIVVACVTATRDNSLQALRYIAEHDALTNLLNRRTFRQRAQEALNQLSHRGRSVAILMIDIDHFKKINDKHGHAAGDEVLCTTAERLRSTIRSEDLCARIGGEEFIVFIPEGTPELLDSIAQRIHQSINGDLALSHTSEPLSITVSIGAVLSSPASTHLDDMLLKADQALYSSKEKGRNRTTVTYDIQGLRFRL